MLDLLHLAAQVHQTSASELMRVAIERMITETLPNKRFEPDRRQKGTCAEAE